MLQYITQALAQGQQALAELMTNQHTLAQLEAAGSLLADCFKRQGHVYSCGNGGSMCDAMHFAEELSGKFRRDRPALGACAISDPSHLSCTANDYGYEYVFSRFLEGHGRPGDVLVGISTSGQSKNVLRAAETAQRQGMKVITLTGRRDSPLGKIADIDLCTPAPSPYADRVQELHIKCIHILIDLCEKLLFPELQGPIAP